MAAVLVAGWLIAAACAQTTLTMPVSDAPSLVTASGKETTPDSGAVPAANSPADAHSTLKSAARSGS